MNGNLWLLEGCGKVKCKTMNGNLWLLEGCGKVKCKTMQKGNSSLKLSTQFQTQHLCNQT